MKWWHDDIVEALNPHWLLPTSIFELLKIFWAPSCSCAMDGHMGAPLHCYTFGSGGQILENWGKAEPKWHCCVMIEAAKSCCLHPKSILDVYKVCLSTFAVDGHMGAPLHCYTCAGGGKSLENWGKAEEKWHCGVMVEAVNHCWLHPTSILDRY